MKRTGIGSDAQAQANGTTRLHQDIVIHIQALQAVFPVMPTHFHLQRHQTLKGRTMVEHSLAHLGMPITLPKVDFLIHGA